MTFQLTFHQPVILGRNSVMYEGGSGEGEGGEAGRPLGLQIFLWTLFLRSESQSSLIFWQALDAISAPPSSYVYVFVGQCVSGGVPACSTPFRSNRYLHIEVCIILCDVNTCGPPHSGTSGKIPVARQIGAALQPLITLPRQPLLHRDILLAATLDSVGSVGTPPTLAM